MMFWTCLILRLVLFSFELHGVSFCLNFYKLNFCHFFYSERTTIFNLYWSIFLIQPFFLSRTDEYMFEKKSTWTDVCMVLYWACLHILSLFCDDILDFSHFELSSLSVRPQNRKLSCTIEQEVLDPDRIST